MDIEYLYLNSDHSWFFYDFYPYVKASCILSDAACEKCIVMAQEKILLEG